MQKLFWAMYKLISYQGPGEQIVLLLKRPTIFTVQRCIYRYWLHDRRNTQAFFCPKRDHVNVHTYEDASAVILSFAEFYADVLRCKIQSLESQLETWCELCKKENSDNLPSTSTECLSKCSATFLPGVYTMLQMFATLSVSTAEPDRSFSALKLLKNYFGSTMREKRIISLIYIHSDLKVDVNNIIDRFAGKNRRLKFIWFGYSSFFQFRPRSKVSKTTPEYYRSKIQTVEC